MLKFRLFSGSIAIGLLVFVLLSSNPLYTILFLLLVSGLGLYEFYTLAFQNGYSACRVYGILWGISIVIAQYCIHAGLLHFHAISCLWFMFVAGSLLLLIIHIFKKKSSNIVISSGTTMLGVFYVACLLNFLVWIKFHGIHGTMFVVYLIAVTKATDIFAYFGGSKWGRHKLIPRVSAKKTIEGLAFGVIGALFVGLGLYRICPIPGGILACWLLPIILALSGQLGDLIESMIKRDLEAKDSGTLIPGLGGILDILDSLLFTAPIMYTYLVLLKV